MRFEIRWHGAASGYSVSRPTYDGGDVVDANDADQLAHALYTVLLHSRVGATQLIEDRIRGAAERVPWFAESYPEVAALLAKEASA